MSGKRSKEHLPVNVYYGNGYQSIGEFKRSRRLQGPFRVIVFCLLAILLPCLLLVVPLYIRYEFYKDVAYHLGESDLVTVDQPISTFWCSGQELRMNATFHAYLLNEKPQISEDLKLIEMKKHMQLADDTLEYWGFFLLQGSKVTLSVCSRFDGARLMVVKGAKNLKHCALIDAAKDRDQIDPWEEDVSAPQGEKIEVTFQHGDQTQPKKTKANSKTTAHSNATTAPGDISSAIVKTGQASPTFVPNQVTENGNSSRRNRGKKGRKPPTPPPAPEFMLDPAAPDNLDLNNTKSPSSGDLHIETLHENVKVLRHKGRLGGGKTNRTKRFVMTEDETYEEGDSKEEDPAHAQDQEMTMHGEIDDTAPPPVGNEPWIMRVENDAETLLNEEEIDEEDIRSSGSSFAKNLWSCYGGDTLFTQTFSPSPKCQSQDAMMKYVRMKMVHEVTSTGYYYYIFYSDNDIVSNDIFARFNIEKVEYSFPNYTNSCLNSTHCSLPLTFFSSEKVLLEVPIQDGVSDEDALAQIVLISTCNPRLPVYLFFPVAILFVIISCAFI